MELAIAALKPLLPGLEAALDDEAVSDVMVNGPGRGLRRARRPHPRAGGSGADRGGGGAGRDPDRPPPLARTRTPTRSSTRGWPTARVWRRAARAADLADDDVIGPVAQRVPHQVADRHAPVDQAPRLEPQAVGAVEPQLERALYGDDAALGRQERHQRVHERRLARAVARHQHVALGAEHGRRAVDRAEAADLLQALNTGHGGSLATVHTNNAEAALSRLATCAMQASDALP